MAFKHIRRRRAGDLRAKFEKKFPKVKGAVLAARNDSAAILKTKIPFDALEGPEAPFGFDDTSDEEVTNDSAAYIQVTNLLFVCVSRTMLRL